MKKEIIFGLILICIFAATFVNISILEKITQELTELVDESLRSVESGDWENAEKKAEEAEKLWEKADPYTHIFVRHSEIDSTTDALYDFAKALYSREAGEARGAHKALSAHISSIVGMEKVTLGSIF